MPNLFGLVLPIIELLAILMAVDIGMVKSKSKAHLIVNIVMLVLFAIGEFFLVEKMGYSAVSHIGAPALVACLFVLALFSRNCSSGQFLFGFLYTLLGCMVPVFFSKIMAYFSSPTEFVAIGVYAGTSLVVYLATRLYARPRLRKAFKSIDDGWYLFSVLPCLGVISLSVVIYRSIRVMTITDVEGSAIILLGSISIIAVFFSMFEKLDSAVSVRRKYEAAQYQLENYRYFNEQREEIEEDRRRAQHDHRHSLQLLIDLLEAGKNDEVLERLYQLRGAEDVPMMRFCYNEAVNGTLRLWSMRAMDNGIDMNARVSVPKKTDIDDMELSMLFANLVENAFEGCMRLESDEHERYIDINCEDKDGKLICSIRNSCRKDVIFKDGVPQSQKRKGGIGTISAKRSVEKHGGIIRFSMENGEFTARFVLPI